jgi:hypothetical protein
MNSDSPSERPVSVPFRARWREFRIQLLPLLAFAAVMVSAGVLWRKAVSPLAPDAQERPALGLSKTPPQDPPLEDAALGQVSHAGSNVIARPSGARD